MSNKSSDAISSGKTVGGHHVAKGLGGGGRHGLEGGGYWGILRVDGGVSGLR